MPKKALLAIAAVLLLLLLAAGGAAWWYFLRPSGPSPAAYLPEGTLLLVEVPDGAATFRHYQASPYRKLVEHPAIRRLFERSAAAVSEATRTSSSLAPGQKEAITTATQTLGTLGKELPLLLRGDSFAALTDVVRGKDVLPANRVRFLVGFRRTALPFGADDGARAVFDSLAPALMQNGAAPATGTGDHEGVPYSWIEAKEGPLAGVRLCRAKTGNWDIIAWGEPSLFDWIDRTAGRLAASSSLASSTEYKRALAEIDPKADVIEYVGPGLFGLYVDLMEKVNRMSARASAPLPSDSPNTTSNLSIAPSPRGTEIQRLLFPATHGAAAQIFLTPDGLRSSGAWMIPRAERTFRDKFYPTTARFDTLELTSPTTVAFFGSTLSLPAYWEMFTTTPGMEQVNTTLEQSIKGLGFDLKKNLIDAVGTETTVLADWPAGQDLPDVLIAETLADADAFGALFDKVGATFGPFLAMLGTPTKVDADGVRGFGLRVKGHERFSPTLFATSRFWGISLRSEGVTRLVPAKRPESVQKPLTQEAILAPLGPLHAGDGFTHLYYMRLPELWSRSAVLLRPWFRAQLAKEGPDGTLAKAFGPWRGASDLDSLGSLLGDWTAAVTSDADAWRMTEAWTAR